VDGIRETCRLLKLVGAPDRVTKLASFTCNYSQYFRMCQMCCWALPHRSTASGIAASRRSGMCLPFTRGYSGRWHTLAFLCQHHHCQATATTLTINEADTAV
jgi:hypothetical protein